MWSYHPKSLSSCLFIVRVSHFRGCLEALVRLQYNLLFPSFLQNLAWKFWCSPVLVTYLLIQFPNQGLAPDQNAAKLEDVKIQCFRRGKKKYEKVGIQTSPAQVARRIPPELPGREEAPSECSMHTKDVLNPHCPKPGILRVKNTLRQWKPSLLASQIPVAKSTKSSFSCSFLNRVSSRGGCGVAQRERRGGWIITFSSFETWELPTE